jgi:hypothetical protein
MLAQTVALNEDEVKLTHNPADNWIIFRVACIRARFFFI